MRRVKKSVSIHPYLLAALEHEARSQRRSLSNVIEVYLTSNAAIIPKPFGESESAIPLPGDIRVAARGNALSDSSGMVLHDDHGHGSPGRVRTELCEHRIAPTAYCGVCDRKPALTAA